MSDIQIGRYRQPGANPGILEPLAIIDLLEPGADLSLTKRFKNVRFEHRVHEADVWSLTGQRSQTLR
jgi:hypothetical protein